MHVLESAIKAWQCPNYANFLAYYSIPKRFAYYSQQETYYSDPNRHCYGKIVHGTPTLTYLAAWNCNRGHVTTNHLFIGTFYWTLLSYWVWYRKALWLLRYSTYAY